MLIHTIECVSCIIFEVWALFTILSVNMGGGGWNIVFSDGLIRFIIMTHCCFYYTICLKKYPE